MLHVACPVQNLIENVHVLHAHGILLHGHLHYKWMVAISEILRTKALLKKKDQMDLCQFQSNVANALLLGNKEKDIPKRGRPSSSSSSTPNGPSPAKKRYSAAFPIPVEDIRFDRVGHFPVLTKKQNRCRFCPRGYSYIRCRKCNIQLCLVKKRNCFYAFIPNKYNEKSN